MSPLAQEIMLTLRHQGAVSGHRLAQHLGVSRAAIWKQVQALRAAGVAISASSGSGYHWQQPVALLDAGEIFACLQPAVAERLQHLQCLPECDSTSAVLARAEQAGVACCMSEQQTAGRGRRGRHWQAPAYGSLLLSLRWEFAFGASALALLGIRVGLLLRDVLQDQLEPVQSSPESGLPALKLKWPNDVVVQQANDSAKLAGILIEMQGGMDGPCTVIIGVGINVGWPAEWLQQLREQLLHSAVSGEHQALPPVDLRTLGGEVSRNRLAALLINRLAELCMQLEQGQSLTAEALLDSWRQHDLLLGQRICVRSHSDDVLLADGVAGGIDVSGAYLVHSGAKSHSFNASAISLRPWPQTAT
ncbi:MAG: bifunctional biotin--[acetyl-CoA-carboxylase] ligase/biotin operon repressor BirA [Wenzhouxiangellaceae bacterium]